MKKSCLVFKYVCTKERSLRPTPKKKNFFFGRNNKSRSSALRNFCFIKIFVLTELRIFLLSWFMFFCQKSVILKQALLHFCTAPFSMILHEEMELNTNCNLNPKRVWKGNSALKQLCCTGSFEVVLSNKAENH